MGDCKLMFVRDLECQNIDKVANGIHSTPRTKYAILAKNVEYSHKGSKENVLNKLNLSACQGSIYGLTGSSGCGKTTLISCILGILPLSGGNIYLYGCNINSPFRQQLLSIPGKGVGLMPQEISLYSSFTTFEVLSYFGRLYGMPAKEIKDAAKRLLKLLSLSRSSTLIGSLSGGQQRRVSFAVSLIHSPKLLVLDEPTVGMDPLLRKRIWDYLRGLVDEKQVTVLVTSHYLDEMRNSDKVGMMSNGRIVAEDSPENLLAICNTASLDEVVLTVSKNPEQFESLTIISAEEPGGLWIEGSHFDTVQEGSPTRDKLHRTRTLFLKNILVLFRNIPLLFFVVCIPAIHVTVGNLIGETRTDNAATLFLSRNLKLLRSWLSSRLITSVLLVRLTLYLARGDLRSEPTQLALGVVNGELSAPLHNNGTSALGCPLELHNELNVCELNLLSCRYLNHLASNHVSLVYFNSENGATAAVKNGHIYGYVSFSSNFSDSLVSRALLDWGNDSLGLESIVDQSRILVRLDQSNTVAARHLQRALFISQGDFLKSVLSACEANQNWGSYPLQFATPIFGKQGGFSLSEYMAPAAPVPLLFFFAIISTGLRLVEERNSGMLKRMLVSGVNVSEIIAAYTASEALITIVQSVIMFSVLVWLQPMFSATAPLVAGVLLFCLLAGFTGMSLGFLLGSACTDQIQVAIIAVAFVLPNMVLTGSVWPIEAMPRLMQNVVLLLPGSLPVEASRSIWRRGLELSHPNVWPGVAVLIAYILMFNILTLIYHKRSKTMSLA